MIVELTVENIAIIERAQIALGPGFTVLTGETGAGKSLLIDAIELVLGERADSELVRAGAPKASVSVVFDLSSRPGLIKLCQDQGIPVEDASLYIHREVFAEGRSQCRVGGKLIPVSQLKQLGSLLVDLHGQHDHQSLLDPETHVGYLDAWIGEPAFELLNRVGATYYNTDLLRHKLSAIRQGQRDREHKLDLLKFQINEIEAVMPKPGELPELEILLSRLRNMEKLAAATFGSLSMLQDQEGSADEKLGACLRQLEGASILDPTLEPTVKPIRDSLILLQEGIHSLRTYADTLESDPNRLDEVATRIDSLQRLRRKYGDDETAILEYLEKAKAELELLDDAESAEYELNLQVAESERELSMLCAELAALRHDRAAEFSDLVEQQLQDLAMEQAIFEVSFKVKQPDATGAENVEFFFSANGGESARPLSKIASGGEVSRVMLAIKTALAGKAGVPSLIFDEVDTGLGGRAAAVVARKLAELAAHYQVVVISHLPQIAAAAASHFRIEKKASDGRVQTSVLALNRDQRIAEVARMLAGEEITETAMANARELIGS
jgi:DNA repair protein RecN (Recombination protein N)